MGEGMVYGKNQYVKGVDDGERLSSYYLNDIYENKTDPQGKAFETWCLDPELTKPVTDEQILNTIVTSDITYYARYSEAYSVTFDANGGEFYSKTGTSYTVNVAKGTSAGSKVPTMKSSETKVFEGWFEDRECTKEILNVYSHDISGNTVFYAGWTDCYVLTFKTNMDGAVFENGSDTLKLQIVKGTPYRYGSKYDTNAQFYKEPETTYNGTKLQLKGWTENADGSGALYQFTNYSHIKTVDGVQTRYEKGFVPVSNMTLYARWNDPVTVTLDTNGGKFTDSEYYTGYGWTFNNDLTKASIKIAKGDTVGTVESNHPYAQRNGYYSGYYYYDKAGKQYANPSDIIEKDTTLYYIWHKSSSGGGSSGSSSFKVKYHAGEGSFGGETVRENTVYLNSSYSYPIPEIADDTRAFSGWYTDEKLTKPYADQKYDDSGEFRWSFPKKINNLYAGYGKAFRVTMDANGGYFDEELYASGQSRRIDPDEGMRKRERLSEKILEGASVRVSDYTGGVRRDGDKLFGGWYLDRECTQKAKITNSTNGIYYDLFKPLADTTLYAKWVDYAEVRSVTATAGSDKIDIGTSAQLYVTAEPASENAADRVDWIIDDYKYGSNNKQHVFPASITKTGKVTGKAEGSVTYIAEINGVRSNPLTINVSNTKKEEEEDPIPLTAIKLYETEIVMDIDDRKSIGFTKEPLDATEAVTFLPDRAGVITVSPEGNITPLAVGETTVTVAGGNVAPQYVKVTVKAMLKEVRLNNSYLNLNTHQKTTLTATAAPSGVSADFIWKAELEDGTPADGILTLIPSNDGSSARVLADKAGKAKITVTAEDRENPVSCNAAAYVVITASDLSNVSGNGVSGNTAEEKLEKLEEAAEAKETSGRKLWIDGLEAEYTYEGLPVEPEVSVYYDTMKLRLGREYTVSYKDNKAVGDNALITVTGKGNYSGKVSQSFKIVAAPAPSANAVSLKGAKITKIPAQEYTGSAVTPVPTVTLKDKTPVDISRCHVTYSKNLDAGTATVFVTGNGTDYKDGVKATFKITAKDISMAGGLGIDCEKAAVYRPGGAKPWVIVTYDDGKNVWTLREGVDYKLTYGNNKALNGSKKPTVTVTGQGNFKGKAPAKEFEIKAGQLSDLTAGIPDLLWKSGKKGSAYQAKVKIYDADGIALKAKTDYTIKEYYDVTAGMEITSKSSAKDMKAVKDGDLIRVTIEPGSAGTYEGRLTATYRLLKNKADIKDLNKMKADKIPDQAYTGAEITCDDKIVLRDASGTELVQGRDYEIACYINNIKKGTASALLLGKGDYSGTKTVKFKITAAKTDKDTYLGFWNKTTGGFDRTGVK